MKRLIYTATALISLFLVSAPTAADVAIGVEFSRDEVRIITQWYRDQGPRANNNGRGRNGGLPPGIARNLERGKALPPGIAKQFLPEGLIALLPAPRAGYERVVIDGKVLLVEIATRVIHDVLVDVILD